ncbi:MAG: WD40 repeat domain-containing protein [Spirochaetales bacterium]|nr:WD40 repeat domain-containing protein [Spirochaetales bacterium]
MKIIDACIAELHDHRDFVGSIVCVSNSQFISSSEDSRMIVWDFDTKKAIEILTEHQGPVNYMSLSPDKRHLVSASDDYTIKIWDVSNWNVIRTLEGHTDYISKAAVTTTGRVVSVSRDQTVRVWEFNTGKCLHILEGHNSWVYMLAVSPDGTQAVTASVNGTFISWDLIGGKPVNKPVDAGGDVTYVMGLIVGGKNTSGTGHKEYPCTGIWLKNGQIITAAEDIIIWNEKNYTEAKRLEYRHVTLLIQCWDISQPWSIKDGFVFVLMDQPVCLTRPIMEDALRSPIVDSRGIAYSILTGYSFDKLLTNSSIDTGKVDPLVKEYLNKREY